MHSSYTFTTGSAVFDEQNLLSAAGWCQCWNWLSRRSFELINERVDLPSTRVKSGASTRWQADLDRRRMMCGADSIDDANVLRAAAHPVFNEVYAHRRWDLFARVHLRHTKQLAAVARASDRTGGAHPAAGADERMFWTSTRCCAGLRPRQAGRLLRSCQDRQPRAAAAVPTDHHHLHGDRRAGDRRGAATERQSRLRRGAAYQLKQAITTAKAINPDAPILVRGDSMFGTKKVITTCIQRGAEFSLSISRNKRINAAIAAIDEPPGPGDYPGASKTRHRALISDAQVAETPYTLRLARAEH
ncbi:transposase, IS4 family [Mycobacterium xenopi 4042]|uniref:Transposase, IS4 family n=1 Tax=Mycobacterium xenopi 4042 TaxID=1299334 RepID=X8AFP3_MYCXE|nr:transposase, IS4 family [Mycobacterium xenopi 4042]